MKIMLLLIQPFVHGNLQDVDITSMNLGGLKSAVTRNQPLKIFNT